MTSKSDLPTITPDNFPAAVRDLQSLASRAVDRWEQLAANGHPGFMGVPPEEMAQRWALILHHLFEVHRLRAQLTRKSSAAPKGFGGLG